MLSEAMQVVAELARAFDGLGVPYVVGGSFASSLYGTPRATWDVDLAADLDLSQVELLVAALEQAFYVDRLMVRDAVMRRTSFNVIHRATMMKADVFVSQSDAWSQEELARGRHERLEAPSGPVQVRFASPEDTLLHKLVWYDLGRRASDRQWGDILGILRVQGTGLDDAYLDRWAVALGVGELLGQARDEA